MNLTIKLLLLILLMLLTGCGEITSQKVEYRYKKGMQQKAADFIVECIDKSTQFETIPSDTIIKACENTAMNIFGERVVGFHVWNSATATVIINFGDCELAESAEELRVCR